MKLALFGAAIAATVNAGQCPPKDWERCGKAWPPAENATCCSRSRWIGSSKWHCEAKYGGIDASKECCEKVNGKFICKDDSKTEAQKQQEKEEEMQCPPKGWDRCGKGKWPPTRTDAPCCSSSGFMGQNEWYCEKNGGIDPRDHCCTVKDDGTLDCITGKGFDKKKPEPKKPSSDSSESDTATSEKPKPKKPVKPSSESEPSESETGTKTKTKKPVKPSSASEPSAESEPSSETDNDAQCPPAGWDRCGEGKWPPPVDGFCCSTGGWLGDTNAHCTAGGLNAKDKCCKQTESGHFKCKLPKGTCPKPPKVCTGDKEIDAVLRKSDIGCQIGLHKLNPTYTWDGFCTAIRQFNGLKSDRKLFLGDNKSSKSCKQGLSNVAGLLAQAMWESGGDAPWSACDENNYTGWKTAPCTQRDDGILYAGLNDQPWACPVKKDMEMKAETFASWTPGPMKCGAGENAGCCWWGRGAIQTTGPNNYGNLQNNVFSKIDALKHIDLCENPEAICQNESTKWLGAIFYWAHDVQGFEHASTKTNFHDSLDKFVASSFDRKSSVVSGSDFATGTGGMVNNGSWTSAPHENQKRLNNFDFIMDILKEGGADSCSTGANDDKTVSESEDEKTKSESEDEKTKSDDDKTESEVAPKPSKKCPPKNWGGNCPWPPTNGAHCCSEWGWPGVTEGHCKNADAVAEGCCTKDSTGALNCDGGDADADDDSDSKEIDGEEQCPPKGWERCGEDKWPPPADGFCCGASGWLGNQWGHCNNGGINAKDKCCVQTQWGHFKCKLPEGSCPKPPSDCTGNPAIDAVLEKSNIGCELGLTTLNPTYTWEGFCTAVRQFNGLESERKLFLGDKTENSCQQGIANIGALLAQAMWESGGDAPWSACDENNYTGWKTAPCTQRTDGTLYAGLNDQPWACPVKKDMEMTAVTHAAWTPGPMQCGAGENAGCCWWGRGAIQTTGPNNYGNLQNNVFSKIDALKHIDLCENPEAICQNESTKWLGAIFYWAHDVQGFAHASTKTNFHDSLDKFVASSFDRKSSVVSGSDFATGTGGMVNNGSWASTPHQNQKRLNNFDYIIHLLKEAGGDKC